MALRVAPGTDVFGKKEQAAAMGGWRIQPGATNVTDHITFMNRHPLARQNNDGPGWTANRTSPTASQFDLYRPIPFRWVVRLPQVIMAPKAAP